MPERWRGRSGASVNPPAHRKWGARGVHSFLTHCTPLAPDWQEASFIMRGSAVKVLELNQDAKSEIWRAVAAGGAETYTRAASSLQLAPVSVRGAAAQVPLRVMAREPGPGVPASWRTIRATSRPVALASDGEGVGEADRPAVSLRQALLGVLHDGGLEEVGDLDCTICGLHPDPDAALAGLHAALAAGDGFLYAVLRVPWSAA